MSAHFEAVLGGARWRLTLHEDGRWEVARRGVGLIWDDTTSGNLGTEGVRNSADDLRKFGEWFADAGADVLDALADIAERAQSNGVTQEGA